MDNSKFNNLVNSGIPQPFFKDVPMQAIENRPELDLVNTLRKTFIYNENKPAMPAHQEVFEKMMKGEKVDWSNPKLIDEMLPIFLSIQQPAAVIEGLRHRNWLNQQLGKANKVDIPAIKKSIELNNKLLDEFGYIKGIPVTKSDIK